MITSPEFDKGFVTCMTVLIASILCYLEPRLFVFTVTELLLVSALILVYFPNILHLIYVRYLHKRIVDISETSAYAIYNVMGDQVNSYCSQPQPSRVWT